MTTTTATKKEKTTKRKQEVVNSLFEQNYSKTDVQSFGCLAVCNWF